MEHESPKVTDELTVAGDALPGDQEVQYVGLFDVADCFFVGAQCQIVPIALQQFIVN